MNSADIQKSEAKILAGRWCLQTPAVLAWMQARGLMTVMDLMRHFDLDHATAMEKAQADFWEFST